jgi:phosphatidylglycerophosphate synthase
MKRERSGNLAAQYARSMKLKGMDGPIDLFIYRPVGFLVAWALSFTGASPNAVTLGSVAFGLAAGLAALPGTASAFLLCALLFQLSNFLDCADGQLARLTGKYSKEGRILDGFADYAVNGFVFIGALSGLLRSGKAATPTILLVVAGAVATAICCMYYDRAVTRFSRVMNGYGPSEDDEIEYARGRSLEAKGANRMLWSLYSVYLRAQLERGAEDSMPTAALSEASKVAYAEAMRPLLSAWSFTGPSAHVLGLLVFAAVDRVEAYFVACVALLAPMIAFLFVQQLVDLRFKPEDLAED